MGKGKAGPERPVSLFYVYCRIPGALHAELRSWSMVWHHNTYKDARAWIDSQEGVLNPQDRSVEYIIGRVESTVARGNST